MSTAQLNKVHISFPNSLINMDKHASMHAHTHMHARKLAGIYAQRHAHTHTHTDTHTHASLQTFKHTRTLVHAR